MTLQIPYIGVLVWPLLFIPKIYPAEKLQNRPWSERIRAMKRMRKEGGSSFPKKIVAQRRSHLFEVSFSVSERKILRRPFLRID